VSDVWEDRREEKEAEGADTALKTKTPHVNVGKNANNGNVCPRTSTQSDFPRKSMWHPRPTPDNEPKRH